MAAGDNRLSLPRKAPVQARATETVGTILEATIQLLAKDGDPAILTTNLIAKRAGVSVGTYYQYFPNKEAVLLALVSRHLRRVSEVLEGACKEARGLMPASMASTFVRAYLEVHLRHRTLSVVVYRIAPDIGAGPILRRERQIVVTAIADMLQTSPEMPVGNLDLIALTFFEALSGAMRAALRFPYGVRSAMKWQEHLEHLGQFCLASYSSPA